MDIEDFVISYTVRSANNGLPGIAFRGSASVLENLLFTGPYTVGGQPYDAQYGTRRTGEWQYSDLNSGKVPANPPYRVSIWVKGNVGEIWIVQPYIQKVGVLSDIPYAGRSLAIACWNYAAYDSVEVEFTDILVMTQ